MVHGRFDDTCPPPWARATQRAMTKAGVDATLEWYDDGHAVRAGLHRGDGPDRPLPRRPDARLSHPPAGQSVGRALELLRRRVGVRRGEPAVGSGHQRDEHGDEHDRAGDHEDQRDAAGVAVAEQPAPRVAALLGLHVGDQRELRDRADEERGDRAGGQLDALGEAEHPALGAERDDPLQDRLLGRLGGRDHGHEEEDAEDVEPGPLAHGEGHPEQGDGEVDEQEGADRVGAEAEPGDEPAADDEPEPGDAEDDAPRLDAEERQAVGVHQRDVDTGDQVVERREEDQRDQPRDGGDRGDRPAEVEARPALLRLRDRPRGP